VRFAVSASLVAALVSVFHLAIAAQPRSGWVKAEFKRLNPCPATGLPRGPCPGYVIDHIVPLCAGGSDTAANMQWQAVEAAKIKDRDERRQCRAPTTTQATERGTADSPASLDNSQRSFNQRE
jgi:hypothetical protein